MPASCASAQTYATNFRNSTLVEPVIENLPRLIAASEAVGKFFSVLDEVDQTERTTIGRRLLEYVAGGRFVPDYQIMWLLEPFTAAAEWNNLTELRAIARNHRQALVRRQAILAIGTAGDRAALWDVRVAFEGASNWESRAIAFACRTLPADERDAFYRTMAPERDWTRDNMLIKATKEYARQLV